MLVKGKFYINNSIKLYYVSKIAFNTPLFIIFLLNLLLFSLKPFNTLIYINIIYKHL
jgi:hypothetical protein